MTGKSKFWQRLFSFALALVMVLGWLPPLRVSANEQTVTLFTAQVTKDDQQIPAMYTVTVTDWDQQDVTTEADITWHFEGEKEQKGENAESDAAFQNAEVTWQGLTLTVDQLGSSVSRKGTFSWPDTINAGDEIQRPTLAPEGFTGTIPWSITQVDGNAVQAGDIATVGMGELTAKATIGGREVTLTATVVPAPVQVDKVEPAAGWYMEMPQEVTIYGSNHTTLENSDQTVSNGVDNLPWADDNGSYTATFTPEAGTPYTIGGQQYFWDKDSVEPSIQITAAYVNDAGDTVVNYTYTVGPSDGEVTIAGERATVSQASSASGTMTLSGKLEKVTGSIQNNVVGSQPVTTDEVKVTPSLGLEITGAIKKDDSGGQVTLYAAQDGVLTLKAYNALNGVRWKVNGSDKGTGNEIQLKAADYVNGFTVTLTDGINRSVTSTIGGIVLDTEAPVITVETLPSDDTTHYFNSDQTYTITITDKVMLDKESIHVTADGMNVDLTEKSSTDTQYTGTFTLKDGDTLNSLKVSAEDKAGLSSVQEFQTNVVVDTTPPEVTGTIAISYIDEDNTVTEGKISSLYRDTASGETYLVLNEAVGAGTETEDSPLTRQKVRITVTYKLEEKNLDDNVGSWTMKDGAYQSTQTFEVEPDKVKQLTLSVSAKDLAGNVPTGKLTLGSEIQLGLSGDTYSTTVYVDRRAPEDQDNPVGEPPEVTLSVDSSVSHTDEETQTRYFKNNFDFSIAVKDEESGLADKELQVKVSGANVTYPGQTVRLDDQGEAKIKMEVAQGQESKDAAIEFKILDNVGNYYQYFESFGVDTLAPRVTVQVEGERTNTVGTMDFYQKPVTLTFALKDQLPCEATVSYMVDGVEGTIELVNGESKSLTLEEGQTLTSLTVTAQDAIGNETQSFEDYSFGNSLQVDGTAPVITISRAPQTPVCSKDGVDYFGENVVYTVALTEANVADGEAKLSYTIDGTAEEVNLLEQQNYSYTFTVEEGQALEAMSAYAVDTARNKMTELTGVSSETNTETGWVNYTGNKVAVDSTKPSIQVTKELVGEGRYVQTVDGKAYYTDGQVKYTVTIRDRFLSEDSQIAFTYGDGAVMTSGTENFTQGGATLSAEDTLTLSFTVEDGKPLTGIRILSKDMIGQDQQQVNVRDVLDPSDMIFAAGQDGSVEYIGPTTIVDTLAPQATLVLKGDIETLVEKNGIYYVKMKTSVEGASGSFDGAQKETVELILNVKDTNLSLTETMDKTYLSSATEGKGWKWIAEGTEAEYRDSVTVNLHDTAYFEVDVSAYDLAGHPITLDSISSGENEGFKISFKPQTGTFQKTISLDRRTPSTDDGEVPEIVLHDNSTNKTKALNGLDLYPASFNFGLSVKDGKGEEVDEKHAGLKLVTWNLTGGGVVTDGSNKKEFASYASDHFEEISVGGAGETDNAVLTITAVDNVDNTINYEKKFAFDNLAPRVKVTVSGESVRGNEYFNQDRVATVELRDIHMPDVGKFGEYVHIETQGQESGWKQTGDGVYVNTFTFAEDGEYTFSMTARDCAGNVTGNDAVEYVGEHPTQFVVDKTNPVIAVTFTPGAPSGRDNRGVDYYDQQVTATVTITERNFAAGDVVARFTPATLRLGNWTGDLEHKSSVSFPEGNNYGFTIEYVDLAGNRADNYVSRTFSVDLTAPTVTISRGDLTNESMNVIAGDLTLGLTIADEQSNLRDYQVTLTHTDSTFKQSVVSGADYYTITTQEERTTVLVNFDEIERLKENDGLYTLEISASDYAGNQVQLTPELVFSLNRFGSTFTTDDPYTLQFLTTGEDGNVYHNNIEKNLIIQEINPNRVWNDGSKKEEGSVLTVVVNGTSTQMSKGSAYQMTVEEEESKSGAWYVYTYEISADTFKANGSIVDGRYAVLIYGEDEAGNKNTNESNDGRLQQNADGVYTGKVEFVLDATPPVISTVGIESGKIYNATSRQLDIFLTDNTPSEVSVYWNNQIVPLSETADGLSEQDVWMVWDDTVGSYMLNVPEQSGLFGDQNIRIEAVDAAGNTSEQAIEGFLISTNLLVRMLNSTVFMILLAVFVVAGVAVVVIFLRRRKTYTKA